MPATVTQTDPESLERIARILKARLRNPGASFSVNRPADVAALNALDNQELQAFAKSHGFNVVRRMGGSIVEFTPVGRAVY